MTLDFFESERPAPWSRVGARRHWVARPRFTSELASARDAPRLAIGRGRSYSDVGMADRGRLVDMTRLDRFRSFDPDTGILVAEAGTSLDAVLRTFVPRGFFVPVTPGTRFVTLGGAVASDVHGKNHARAGTFGRHVEHLVIERSDAGAVRASANERPELFAATVGGLGLTGIIAEVALRLQPIASAMLDVETLPAGSLDALCDALEASEDRFEHSVAWIDCTATGRALGRGIVARANWAADGPLRVHESSRGSVPTDRLGALLNPLTLRLFNAGYFALGRLRARKARIHYAPFFYPLDGIGGWNRLYGSRGFYQYQCAIPARAGHAPIRALLERIAASGEGSFLAVLKRFGAIESPGMLSFPIEGLTLALDFRNRGAATLALLAELDTIVAAAGGRLYPAKDLRMPPAMFRQGYPQIGQFCTQLDPACRSDFWQRMAQ